MCLCEFTLVRKKKRVCSLFVFFSFSKKQIEQHAYVFVHIDVVLESSEKEIECPKCDDAAEHDEEKYKIYRKCRSSTYIAFYFFNVPQSNIGIIKKGGSTVLKNQITDFRLNIWQYKHLKWLHSNLISCQTSFRIFDNWLLWIVMGLVIMALYMGFPSFEYEDKKLNRIM